MSEQPKKYSANQFEKDVLDLYKTLAPAHAIGDTPVTTQILHQLKERPEYAGRKKDAMYRMVCHYIRKSKVQSGNSRDGRRTYTQAELRSLSLMHPQELREYAHLQNKTLSALYAAVSRFTALEIEDVESLTTTPALRDITVADIEKNGFFDFSCHRHLAIQDTNPDEVRNTVRILHYKYRLTLRAPNILYHPRSGRRYHLSTGEQLALIANPSSFLHQRQEHIREHWIHGVDPITDTHDRPAPEYLRRVKKPKDREKLVRRLGKLVRDTHIGVKELIEIGGHGMGDPIHSQLLELNSALSKLITIARPEFTPSDPATYVDLVKEG